MSIQSTINQGLSLAGLLMSQMPSAKAREDEAAAARAQATAAATAEGRLAKEQEFKAQTEEERRAGVRSSYAAHSKLITPWTKGQSSERTAEEARLTRESALEFGRQLYEFEPTEELATAIGGYERELEEIRRLQEDRRQAARTKNTEERHQETNRRRQSKIQKQKEAEEAAAEAAAIEQRRQAITREITRPFDPTVDKFKW